MCFLNDLIDSREPKFPEERKPVHDRRYRYEEGFMIDSILKAFWQDEEAQDLVEYALLLSFISLVAMALLAGVGGSVKNLWVPINSQLKSAAS